MASITLTRPIYALIVDGAIADVSTHPLPLRNRAQREYNAGRDAYVVGADATTTIEPRPERFLPGEGSTCDRCGYNLRDHDTDLLFCPAQNVETITPQQAKEAN